MILRVWILGFFLLLSIVSLANPIEKMRTNYNKLATQKSLCENMIAEFDKLQSQSALHLGYLGAAQAIWANHVINPLSKINTFKKGKNAIENAIKKDPYNVELRFIRLSIQVNIPSFLNYSSQIDNDKAFIQQHMNSIQSEELKANIRAIL